jgi:hypothetical protein
MMSDKIPPTQRRLLPNRAASFGLPQYPLAGRFFFWSRA